MIEWIIDNRNEIGQWVIIFLFFWCFRSLAIAVMQLQDHELNRMKKQLEELRRK